MERKRTESLHAEGIFRFLSETDADIFCLQETKLQEGQIALDLPGYHQYWSYAEKKGYSGTAIFTKEEPLQVTYGIGVEEHDHEESDHGRVPEFCFRQSIVPNAQQELKRLDYRMQWEADFLAYLKKLEEKKPVIYTGRPRNGASGDRPATEDEPRQCDLHRRGARLLLQSTGKWIYRHFPLFLSGADRNLFLVVLQIQARRKMPDGEWTIRGGHSLQDRLADAKIHTEILGSDHCPIELDIQ